MSDHEVSGSSFGSELRRLRMAAGLSLSSLAEQLHYSKGYLSKVEMGRKAPSRDLARRCDAALGADGELSALFTSLARPTSKGSLVRSDDFAPTTDVLPSAEVTVPTLRSRSGPAALGFEGDVSLAAFADIYKNLRDLAQVLDPSQVLEMIRPYASILRELAQTSEAGAAGQASLLASHFAEFAGWMAQEIGDDGAALRWTDDAVTLARAGGDLDLVAYAYVRRANIAMYQQDAYGTIMFARQAQALECSDRTKGLAAQREAQGHALSGDYEAFHRCLSVSADLLARSEAEPGAIVRGPTKIPDLGALAKGWSLHDLGRSEEAAEILTRLLADTPPAPLRARARIEARLALALATINKVNRACEVVHPVLALGTAARSATIRSDLRQLARILNRRRADPAVRKIMPELSAALTPASPRHATTPLQIAGM